MGKNFSLFTPTLCSFVDWYERSEHVDKAEFTHEFGMNEWFFFRELIKLYIASMIINLDLSTFLRADFRSDSIIEKRCNLKYINLITYEGFNYFFGSKDDKKNAVWPKFKAIAKLIKDEDLNNDLMKVTVCADEYESKYVQAKDRRSRNLSVHYDRNPILVYNDMMELNEDNETKRACAFLAILEPLSFLISKYFKRHPRVLSEYFKLRQPYDLSTRELFNSFQDKTGELSAILNDEIIKFGKYLDKLIVSCNMPAHFALKLGLKAGFVKSFNPVVESVYPGLYLHFIFLDLACAIKAYLHSGYYFEKQLNLRRLRVVIYEGFKKIYGFTDSQESNSFWRKNIYNALQKSTDPTVADKLATIEDNLSQLREYKDIKDDKKREYTVHYRYKEVNNIIPIFHQLINSNPIVEMEKALRLLRLLPSIIKLNKASLEVVYNDFNVKVSSANKNTQTVIDSVISRIEDSNIDEEKKESIIESIKKIKQYLSFN